jgi:hypothetical protein
VNGGALDVLAQVHRRLRRGDFGKDLIEIVEANAQTWRGATNEADRLRAEYVVAEVRGYYGAYAEAAAQLQVEGPRQREALCLLTPDGDEELAKRRLWVVLAYAASSFLMDDDATAREALDACAAALDALDPKKTRLFGTRARLALTRGRLLRQRHDYDRAREQFELATVFAHQRFRKHTKFAELSSLDAAPRLSKEDRETFEEYSLPAQLTTGVSLATGLGWIAYATGALSAARMFLSTAYTLLRHTGDGLHRAYTELLLGAVERARAGDDPQGLEGAIALMQDASKGLLEHPALALRVRAELALAYYRLPQYREQAHAELEALRSAIPSTTRRAFWECFILLIEARLEHRGANHEKARELARQAIRQAEAATKLNQHGPDDQAEAHIVFAEASLAMAKDASIRKEGNREEGLASLRKAVSLGRRNPKIVAVCQLHLAHAYHLRGAPLEARKAYVKAPTVEHGYVQTLAASVEAELKDYYYVDGSKESNESLKQVDHSDRLEAFLFRRAEDRVGPDPEAIAKEVGLSVRGYKRHRKRLQTKGFIVPAARGGGRPRGRSEE